MRSSIGSRRSRGAPASGTRVRNLASMSAQAMPSRPGALGREHRAGEAAAVAGADRDGRALAVAFGVLGRRRADPDLVDQARGSPGRRSCPGSACSQEKCAVGGAGGDEIGRAVRHVDQVGRVQRAAQRGHAGARHGDALDRRSAAMLPSRAALAAASASAW